MVMLRLGYFPSRLPLHSLTSTVWRKGLLEGCSAVSIHRAPSHYFQDINKELVLSRNFSRFRAQEKVPVPDIITGNGYPVEVHYVTTEDGYILQLHRIPHGKKCGAGPGKKVVFVQHGLLCDSSNWVISGEEKSLAYLLADNCYDVWLGNARGNYYSRNHTTWHPMDDREKFWHFSFHEMGVYDLPANFDYIMKSTGTDGLYYIGHSMGTTMFFICMSNRPEYNSKIKLMSALAPVAYTEHMISPLRHAAPFAGSLAFLLEYFGIYEFLPALPPDSPFAKLKELCYQTSPFQFLCESFLFLICGFDSEQMDHELLPVFVSHLPAGTSARTVVHYSQGVPFPKNKTADFRQFDYEIAEINMEVYGQPIPPSYDFANMTAPIALYWSLNDWLGTPVDTERIGIKLPNLQRFYRIEHDLFNHLDFLLAKDVRTLLYDTVIEFMKDY